MVKVRATMICGSDIRAYLKGSARLKPPIVLGHELSGDVVELGEGVEGIKRGERVAVYPVVPCLECEWCRSGHYNLCDRLGGLGYTEPGSFAPYVKVPRNTVMVEGVVPLPSGLSYEEAAAIEPLACCLNGIKASGLKPGETFVIIGDGPIGLLHLQAARAYGAERVYLLGRQAERLALAERLGADLAVDTNTLDPVAEVLKATGGRGADRVMVAVSDEEAVTKGVLMVRKAGTVVLFGGVPPGALAPIDVNVVHYREVRVVGSFSSVPSLMREAAELLASGRVRAEPLITARFTLDRIVEAFRAASEGRELRVLIDVAG